MSGRYFSAEDRDKPLVAIMNQAAARECFGTENPIGKHLTLSHITLTKGEITYEVVGVVANAKYSDIQQPAPPTIYRDLFQDGSIGSQLAVRTRTAPDVVAGTIRETVSSVLKTVPIVRARNCPRVNLVRNRPFLARVSSYTKTDEGLLTEPPGKSG